MKRSDLQNAWFCAAAAAVAFLVTWPFAEMPFDDDWSYMYMVRQLVETGHLRYCANTASLLIQPYWGAIFVKLFGFSFTNLRFSMLPVAAGSAALVYLLGRRAGLAKSRAVFASLLVAFSPLFVPLATSFMTDVPGLFFTLLSLYWLIHSLDSAGGRRLAWLAAGAAAGILGGANRQVVWIVPLSVIPYLALLRRRDAPFVVAASASWLGTITFAALFCNWFNRQPGVVKLPPISSGILSAVSNPARAFADIAPLWLTLLLMALPAALPYLSSIAQESWRGRRGGSAIAIFAACALTALVLYRYPDFTIEPWAGNILTSCGPMGNLEVTGPIPPVQPAAIQVGLAWLVLLACVLLMVRGFCHLRHPRQAVMKIASFFWNPSRQAGGDARAALAVLALANVVAILPPDERPCLFDRYILTLLPCLAIALLSANPPVPRGAMPVAWIFLAGFGLFALACTADTFSLDRARFAAARRLQDAGIAPAAIADGYEYDSWQIVSITRYIDTHRLVANPPAYCYGFYPEYRVETWPNLETELTRFGDVDYFCWLPPFHRQLLIDRFRNPYWLSLPKDHPAFGRVEFEWYCFGDR